MLDFEEQYLDVLQNIESVIAQAFYQDPEIIDFDVERALDALITIYRAEQINREPRAHHLDERAQFVYRWVAAMCEWRLGRQSPLGELDNSTSDDSSPVSLDEMIACLKRIRKSVRTWNKRGGRQGYLLFIQHYVV